MNREEMINDMVAKYHDHDPLQSAAKAIAIFDDIKAGLASRIGTDKIDSIAATLTAGVLSMPE